MSNFQRKQSRRRTQKKKNIPSFFKRLQELRGSVSEVSFQISEDMVSEVTKLRQEIVNNAFKQETQRRYKQRLW